VQCRKIARIFALFKAYSGERAWKYIGDRLQGPCYLNRDNHYRKIRAGKQSTDIGKYSFENRTIKLWNQLSAEALGTFPCRSHITKNRVMTVIISDVKWCDVMWCDAMWCDVMWCEVKWSTGIWSVMIKCLKVKGSEKLGVKIFGEMCRLSWSYSYVVCMWVTVQYVFFFIVSLSHCCLFRSFAFCYFIIFCFIF
jgi:hypothetical protein